MEELNLFTQKWEDNESQTKKAFIDILAHIISMPDITVDFKQRPGVSYSLRPKHKNQKSRSLFAMADIIDDNPDERWLSVCFYGDMITDPEEAGDLVPEGLMGEDGYCFDLYEYDADEIDYIMKRLDEAYRTASKGD